MLEVICSQYLSENNIDNNRGEDVDSNNNGIKQVGEIRSSLCIHLTSKPPGKQKERRSLSLRGSCFSGG